MYLRTNARLIADASQRIGKLVTSLKGFAHLDRAEFGEIDIVQSLENTLALLEPEFRGRVAVEREYALCLDSMRTAPKLKPGIHAPVAKCGAGDQGEGTVRLETKVSDQVGPEVVRLRTPGRGHYPGSTKRHIQSVF